MVMTADLLCNKLISITSLKHTATFSEKKTADQSSGRNMMIKDSQSTETHVGNHVIPPEIEKEKKTTEGDYEEMDNILHAPFTMEYNISYSTVTQTAV